MCCKKVKVSRLATWKSASQFSIRDVFSRLKKSKPGAEHYDKRQKFPA